MGEVCFGVFKRFELLVKLYGIKVKALKIFLSFKMHMYANYVDSKLFVMRGSVFYASRRGTHYLCFHKQSIPFKQNQIIIQRK